MKSYLRVMSGFTCLAFFVFGCTGCQLTNLLQTIRGETNVEDLIPDLEELAAEASTIAATAEEEAVDLTTPYIGYFNLK